MLRQLLPTVAQTSSAQHVNAVDVDKQCSNPKGKQLAHTDTSSVKKRKAVSFDKGHKILVSMSDKLDNETLYKATKKLVKVEWREAFVNFASDRRLGWIKYLTRSS